MVERRHLPPELLGLDELESALAAPTPLCMAVIELDLVGLDPDSTAQVRAEARRRAELMLRDYDELSLLGPSRLVIAMPTLADPTVLERRLLQLERSLADPYQVDDTTVSVAVELAAAVRRPQESPTAFVERLMASTGDRRAQI